MTDLVYGRKPQIYDLRSSTGKGAGLMDSCIMPVRR